MEKIFENEVKTKKTHIAGIKSIAIRLHEKHRAQDLRALYEILKKLRR